MTTSTQVLVIDDDAGVREPLCAWLAAAGLSPLAAATAEAGLAVLEGCATDALVLDLELPDRPGLAVLELLSARLPQLPVIVLTSHREAEVAVACMKAGAYDYLVKPVDEPRVVTTVANALRHRQLVATLAAVEEPRPPAGAPPDPRRRRGRLARVAGDDRSVLLKGGLSDERELAARALHAGSARAGRPFVALRCGDLPPEAQAGRLLGPGAGPPPATLQASGGTLFLDEIERLHPAAQEGLLAAVTAAARARAGLGPGPEFRLVAGTGADLRAAVAAGAFRADLLMRIGVDVVALGGEAPAPPPGESLRKADRERAAVLEALERSAGNRTEASRALGIGRATLYRKLKTFGLE